MIKKINNKQIKEILISFIMMLRLCLSITCHYIKLKVKKIKEWFMNTIFGLGICYIKSSHCTKLEKKKIKEKLNEKSKESVIDFIINFIISLLFELGFNKILFPLCIVVIVLFLMNRNTIKRICRIKIQEKSESKEIVVNFITQILIVLVLMISYEVLFKAGFLNFLMRQYKLDILNIFCNNLALRVVSSLYILIMSFFIFTSKRYNDYHKTMVDILIFEGIFATVFSIYGISTISAFWLVLPFAYNDNISNIFRTLYIFIITVLSCIALSFHTGIPVVILEELIVNLKFLKSYFKNII